MGVIVLIIPAKMVRIMGCQSVKLSLAPNDIFAHCEPALKAYPSSNMNKKSVLHTLRLAAVHRLLPQL